MFFPFSCEWIHEQKHGEICGVRFYQLETFKKLIKEIPNHHLLFWQFRHQGKMIYQIVFDPFRAYEDKPIPNFPNRILLRQGVSLQGIWNERVFAIGGNYKEKKMLQKLYEAFFVNDIKITEYGLVFPSLDQESDFVKSEQMSG